MALTISLRMNNPGPAKYLIEQVERPTFNEALKAASDMADRASRDHFVEITNEVGETMAKINGSN
jgi:hypothetical protein